MEVILFLLKPRARAWQKGIGEISPFDYIRVVKPQKKNVSKESTAPKETRTLEELSRVLDTRGRWKSSDLTASEKQETIDSLSDAEFFGKTMGR